MLPVQLVPLTQPPVPVVPLLLQELLVEQNSAPVVVFLQAYSLAPAQQYPEVSEQYGVLPVQLVPLTQPPPPLPLVQELLVEQNCWPVVVSWQAYSSAPAQQ